MLCLIKDIGKLYAFNHTMSQWRSWIARPPPKGQVAGSNPAWDTSQILKISKPIHAR